MPKLHHYAAFDRSDPVTLDHLAKTQRFCLGIVIFITLTTLTAWIFSAKFTLPPVLTLMKVNTALAGLGIAISLILSGPDRSEKSFILARVLALLVAALAATTLLEHYLGISLGVDTFLVADPHSRHPGLMSSESGISFTLLGVVVFFIRVRNGIAQRVADFLVGGLCVLVLVVVSGYLFGSNPLYKVQANHWTSPQTLLILLLLGFSAFGQRAEFGSFRVLVGAGIGSKIARALAPLLLVLPFLREAARRRLIHSGRLPEHYVTAIGASGAAVVSFALILILAWRINRMEREIHDLSLRDELTGLYNLRGFHLLAGQALRLAQRAQLPFSVLFIDLDNLKQINDELGHGVGSQFLAETGELLLATFRETDVIGRIGGDEFAVAGQFTRADIHIAARRLEDKAALSTPEAGRHLPLSLSIGHITTEDRGRETLQALLTKADKAMYEQKKNKKLQLR
jgi:diguanylate cyclase (GGDEF)-like protein